MRPLTRAAIVAGSIVVVAAVALAVRSMNAWGVFTDVTPGFAGICMKVPTADGPEDIAIDEHAGLVFVSALDRRIKARTGKLSPADGLYVFSLNDPVPHPRKLAGAPKDFHPHGISLYRSGGTLTLMAINHRSDGTHSIDIFAVNGAGADATLAEMGSIQSGELINPNAIAAVDAERFYVTNDHISTTTFGKALDDLLALPRTNTLYFDGTVFRPAAGRMIFPSGAVVGGNGRYLYVGEAYARRVTAFERNPFSGELKSIGEIALPMNPDNLRMGSDGVLWVAGRPKPWAMRAYRDDPAEPAPSEVLKVFLNNGVPVSATPVYTNMGDEIGGASVAAVSGHRMFIGAPLDNHILDCRMDH
ncbi:MAG: hypothetical protein JO167_14370 [Alphaproteobacteria bacterium]|nr:hypothetical protein [Alphaproteobacteria bacterium]MBV9903029.1 hypothetical protein [Alphaproteobacteria bacterium]